MVTKPELKKLHFGDGRRAASVSEETMEENPLWVQEKFWLAWPNRAVSEGEAND